MNPALKKLGYGEEDRVVIIHTDDIGMFQSTVPAYAGLIEAGLISSASTMVPCPWFNEAARFCREHPGVDMGVHLTLNAEWSSYRWGPISTREAASGLLDEEGYFYSDPAKTVERADTGAVAKEFKAQLDRALAAGIDVTHVDAHMGTALHGPFLQLYVDLALEYKLPLFLLTAAALDSSVFDVDPAEAESYTRLVNDLEARGVPLFDAITMLPLDHPTDHVGFAKKLIDGLQPGLTYIILHPCEDTPELRTAAPDWPARVANYAALSSPELRDYVQQSGVHVIGFRQLRDLVQSN